MADELDIEGLKSKSLRGVGWMMLKNGGHEVISLLVSIVLARLLVPEAFGLVALALAAISFLRVFQENGFHTALVQRKEFEGGELDTAFWTVCFFSIVLAILGGLAAPVVGWMFEEPKLVPVLRAICIALPIHALGTVPDAILTRKMDFRTLMIRRLLASIIGGGVAVSLALMGWGVWSLVAKTLISATVGTVAVYVATQWLPTMRFSRTALRGLFAFGINLTGQKLVNFINRKSDDLIVGFFLGTEALGVYTVAYSILLALTSIQARSLSAVALPAFSRLQDNLPVLRRSFYRALEIAALLSFPIFFGFLLVAPEAILVLYGEQWAEAVPIARILAVIGIAHSINLLNGPLFNALNRPSWNMWLHALNAVLNVIGFTVGAQIGLWAVAAAYVLRAYAVYPLKLYCLNRLIHIKVSTYFRRLTAPLLACGVMLVVGLGLDYLLTMAVSVGAVVRLILLVAAGVVTYAAVLFFHEASRDYMKHLHTVVVEFVKRENCR